MDWTFVSWERGSCLGHTLKAYHLRGNLIRAVASETVEISKQLKYESISADYAFVSFAVENLGPWEIVPELLLQEGWFFSCPIIKHKPSIRPGYHALRSRFYRFLCYE